MLDINSLISKKETLVSNQFDDAIHVALCFDKNYGLPAGVLVTSILHNNPDKNFIFHLFVLSINDDDIEKFKLFNNGNVKIELYYVNDNFSINPKTIVLPYLSIATCLRLFVPEYLSGITEKLLYLDCDMLCNSNLNQIITNNVNKKIAAVVIDLEDSQKKRCESCNLKVGTYFNAGMLYINTQLWREFNVTEKALTKINDGSVYEFADQDILNILLANQVKYISSTCNNMLRNYDSEGQLIKSIDTVIFHYIGADKPWFQIYADELYYSYIALSPWKNTQIEIAPFKIPRHLRKYSKFLYKKGKYIAALKFRILYFLNKLQIINSFKK